MWRGGGGAAGVEKVWIEEKETERETQGEKC